MDNNYFKSEEIFNKVEKLCHSKQWTLYRLAKIADIHVNSLYSWRDRSSSPSLIMIESIAKALDVHPMYLLINNEEYENLNLRRKEFIDLWDVLSDAQRDSLLTILRGIVKID